jgi:hypothetical protein
MCRNIKQLRRPESPPTEEEIHDAALQFVRKISGYRVPSAANRPAFDTAVDDVAAAARALFGALPVSGGASTQHVSPGPRRGHSEP